jgi:hypothetical protein
VRLPPATNNKRRTRGTCVSIQPHVHVAEQGRTISIDDPQVCDTLSLVDVWLMACNKNPSDKAGSESSSSQPTLRKRTSLMMWRCEIRSTSLRTLSGRSGKMSESLIREPSVARCSLSHINQNTRGIDCPQATAPATKRLCLWSRVAARCLYLGVQQPRASQAGSKS